MKTEDQLNKEILEITMTISQQFPELSKYISEMPVKTPDYKNPEITIRNLQDYLNSLQTLLSKYSDNHSTTSK